MNEPAVRLEEQIISLFSNLETEIYQGWVLKQTPRHTVIYPLYSGSLGKQDILDRIKACEEISCQKSLSCKFRIVEHTNYYLASLLEENGYKRHCHVIAERYINEAAALSQNTDREARKLETILNKTAGDNIAEVIVANSGSVIGIKRQGLLYLPNGELFWNALFPCNVEINDIFQFAVGNQISRILVSIPENEKLFAYYRESGFHKAYLYYCYQTESKLSVQEKHRAEDL